MWEIILSNLITTLIVGGGILAYHLYRKRLEQQFYARIKDTMTDLATGISQGMLYYMAWKGFVGVQTIKNILETHPVFKDKKILPHEWLDTIETFSPDAKYNFGAMFDNMNDGPKAWKVAHGPQTQCVGGTTWKFGPTEVGSEFCQCGTEHETENKDEDNDTVEDMDSVEINEEGTEKLTKKFYGKIYPMPPMSSKPKLPKLPKLKKQKSDDNEKDSDIGIKVAI